MRFNDNEPEPFWWPVEACGVMKADGWSIGLELLLELLGPELDSFVKLLGISRV